MSTRIGPWVRTVPPGWNLRRLRRIGTTASGSGFPTDLQGETELEIPFYKVKHLGQADARGVLLHADDTIDRSTVAQLSATIFPSGTLVYAKVGAALMLGRVRTLPSPACIDNNMAGFMPSREVNARFLYWAMTQVRFDYLVNPGAVPSLSDKNLLDYPILLPPLDVQGGIANYLDRETKKIDAFIAEQDGLVETLRERRLAVITHAVTHGLRSWPMAATGDPYLASAPEHWRISRFSREMVVNAGQVDPREDPWIDMVLVAPNHLQSGTGRIIGRETAREQGADSGKYVARQGQIVYSKIRPALNKVSIAVEDCLCSADMYALSSRTPGDHRFFAYYMLAVPFHTYATQQSLRVKMPKVNREELGAAPWVVPPLEEQSEIADYLDEQTEKIDALIGAAEGIAAVAKERRSALITAAVTGQIDVHGKVA